MRQNRLFFAVKALAVIGISLAIFLLWEQMARPSFQPCNINATINCDAIISGEVARTFGIPTPIFGLIGYIILLIGAIYRKKRLLLGTAIGGLAFCLWIAYKELFQLHVICPVCILCQIDMITIFILAIILKKSSSS